MGVLLEKPGVEHPWFPGVVELAWPVYRLSGRARITLLWERRYTIDAMPDRQKFLVLVPEHSGAGSITIVRNWQPRAAPGK